MHIIGTEYAAILNVTQKNCFLARTEMGGGTKNNNINSDRYILTQRFFTYQA
jgi:hypothetical protein